MAGPLASDLGRAARDLDRFARADGRRVLLDVGGDQVGALGCGGATGSLGARGRGEGGRRQDGREPAQKEAAAGTGRHLWVSSALRQGDLRSLKRLRKSPRKGERPAFARRPWGGEI